MSDRWQSASRYSNRGFVLLRHWMTEFMKHCTTSSNTLKPMHNNLGNTISPSNTVKPITAYWEIFMTRLTSAWELKETTKVNASKHTLICNASIRKIYLS
jgi:hypothetical protein